eukprot:8738025-Heterocapsa_arctica.AAC.1
MKHKIQNMIITIKIKEKKFIDYCPKWTTSRWTETVGESCSNVPDSAHELVRSSAGFLPGHRHLLRREA